MIFFPSLTPETAPLFVILAKGEFPRKILPLAILRRASEHPEGTIVCCDGAIQNLLDYGAEPDAVVGDLDSFTASRHILPAEKLHRIDEQDTNDLTKAVTFSAETYSPREVCLLGTSGRREDHFVGNLALLPGYTGFFEKIVMPTDYGCFLAFNGEARIEVERGRQISIFSFSGSAVTAEGLKWQLRNTTLPELWCGTLNEAVSDTIYLSSAAPLVVFVADEVKNR
ncbi:thiamine diphosphokinase [Porphyromonas gingivalis]|uniref:thiamine diphosphokinase n=1 Tax=Porphyromonas gingivalis TaxID=837 RepID=UPI0007724689|nr:thiamine diphosphokinase [Porphyromonas gingivalis]ATR91800.1 thiamine diphosphokinase [Porphyromonas gingivalis]ATS08650.1 thiamine diphosphokinase [Porphyromonas gingivalis]KXC07922.1 thiamine pyrophosphokinase [Porphyromonas gingivalis]MCE8173684.1 thiamine diphosphokinase [Porphyromonas gingivalis]MCE8177422.1 thiamine diphosphokinase [Porphyromonas gingivalis]